MEKYGYNSLTSWLAVIACAILSFFVMVPMRLAGLFFVILFNSYNTDRAKASVPIVMFGVLRTLTGPFTAFLGETFGFRAITVTGCILSAIGVGSCFFAENITVATICLGLIYGFGMAFGNTLIPTILKLHFTEHINLVNGLVLAGSCGGAIIMSPVITFLQSTYGTNGMFLILGGIFLNCIPAAILLKHPHNDRRILEKDKEEADNSNQINACHQNLAYIVDEENQYNKKASNEVPVQSVIADKYDTSNGVPVKNVIADKHDTLNEVPVKNVTADKYDTSNEVKNVITCQQGGNSDNIPFGPNDKGNNPCFSFKIKPNQKTSSVSSDVELTGYTDRKHSIKNNLNTNGHLSDRNIVNNTAQSNKMATVLTGREKMSCESFRIFADPTFHLIMLVQSIHAFVTTLNWTIIVDYARDKGISNELSVHFVTFLPVAEMAGNMSLSWITDRHFMSRTNFGLTCFLILILNSSYLIWINDFALMLIGVLVFGFISGAVASTFPGIVIHFIVEEQQNMALASRFILYAFLCMLKTPIIGYFRGTLGSYDWVYCIIMACSFTCCILVKLTPLLASCRNRKKEFKECK